MAAQRSFSERADFRAHRAPRLVSPTRAADARIVFSGLDYLYEVGFVRERAQKMALEVHR